MIGGVFRPQAIYRTPSPPFDKSTSRVSAAPQRLGELLTVHALVAVNVGETARLRPARVRLEA